MSSVDRPALTPSQAQRALGLESVATVYRMIRRGQLPAVKLSGRTWRIRAEDVDALLAGQVGVSAASNVDALAEHVAKILASAPRLTEDQRAVLAELLAPIRAGQQGGTRRD
jgi:excisionase family DNA binding protein